MVIVVLKNQFVHRKKNLCLVLRVVLCRKYFERTHASLWNNTISFHFCPYNLPNQIKRNYTSRHKLKPGKSPIPASPKKVTKVLLPDDESIIDESGQGKRKTKADSGWCHITGGAPGGGAGEDVCRKKLYTRNNKTQTDYQLGAELKRAHSSKKRESANK